MRLIVTRPQPDAARTAARLATLGHDAIVEPMLTVTPLPEPEMAMPAALVLTSANAARALVAWQRVDAWRGLPVFAVGRATADAAREAGFLDVRAGAGAAADLVAVIRQGFDPADGRLLHVSGAHVSGAHVSGAHVGADIAGRLAAAGFDAGRVVAYRTEKVASLSATARRALRDGTIAGVLFYSYRTAMSFRAAIVASGQGDSLGRELLADVALYALSEQVAAGLRPLAPPARLVISARPDEDGMMALLDRPGSD